MAKVKEITDVEFEKEVLQNKGVVMVDFSAEWCGPCKLMDPVLEELAQEYEGKASLCRVDVDKNQRYAVENGIMSIPTFLFFKNGEKKDMLIGAVPKNEIKKRLDALVAKG